METNVEDVYGRFQEVFDVTSDLRIIEVNISRIKLGISADNMEARGACELSGLTIVSGGQLKAICGWSVDPRSKEANKI